METMILDFPSMMLPFVGNRVGSSLILEDIPVSQGQFTVLLDFGSGIFNKDALWLQISVKPGNLIGWYTTLSPRQSLTPAPYTLSFPSSISRETQFAVLAATNTSSLSGEGVSGSASGTSGYGISGYATGTTGQGVHGVAVGNSGIGVMGYAPGPYGRGVLGNGSQYDFYAGGNGINYGPFTGGHEVRLSEDFSKDIKPGMIVSVTGQTRLRRQENGAASLSSTLPTVKLSSQVADKAVFGVLVAEVPLPKDHWYETQDGERFATVNALGEGRVWISNFNGDIELGDYITTSSIPGYGQRQDDDLLRSSTLGKAIEAVDWDSVTDTVWFNGQAIKVYLIAVVYTSG
jgi:hypothetical protein